MAAQNSGVPYTRWKIQSCKNCGRHAVRFIDGECEACGNTVSDQ